MIKEKEASRLIKIIRTAVAGIIFTTSVPSVNYAIPAKGTPLYEHLLKKPKIEFKINSPNLYQKKSLEEKTQQTIAEKIKDTEEISKLTNNPVNKQDYELTKLSDLVYKPLVSPSSFTPNMSFSEAIDILKNSTNPPLNIVVLWREIEENADIYKDTPIGIDSISGVLLRTHLRLLLSGVSGGSTAKLGYDIEGGIITIATEDSLQQKKKTYVYDIIDLIQEPANYRVPPILIGGGMMPGGMMPGGMMGMAPGMDYGQPYGGYGGSYRGYGGYSGGYGGYGGYGIYSGSYRTRSYGNNRAQDIVDLIQNTVNKSSINERNNSRRNNTNTITRNPHRNNTNTRTRSNR